MGTHFEHLSMDERNTIHRRRWEGDSLPASARALEHPASTVARMALRQGVVMDFHRGGSPEQSASWRRHMNPDKSAQRVSHETLELVLYALPRGELRKALLARLRQGHKTSRPQGGQDRPAKVADRAVPGQRPKSFNNKFTN